MPPTTPDSYKISLNIINAIKQHPVLYVPEIKGNGIKPQEFRQKVWKKISNELGLDPAWVKCKWKNLRDTYCRILKSRDKSKGLLKKKNWIFEEHLEFLNVTYMENCNIELTDDYINEINAEDDRSSNLVGQLEDIDQDDDDDDYGDFLEIIENEDEVLEEHASVQSNNNDNDNKESKVIVSNLQSVKKQAVKRPVADDSTDDHKDDTFECVFNEFSTTNLVLPKKSMTHRKSNHNKKIIDISDNKKSFDYENSIDSFFQNIAQNVKKLPPKVQADIKMDVSKIVSEAEICYLKKNTQQRVQKYSNMPGMVQKLVLVPCHMIDHQMKTNKR